MSRLPQSIKRSNGLNQKEKRKTNAFQYNTPQVCYHGVRSLVVGQTRPTPSIQPPAKRKRVIVLHLLRWPTTRQPTHTPRTPTHPRPHVVGNPLASTVCSAFQTCTLAAGLLSSLPSKNDQDIARLVHVAGSLANVHAMPPATSLDTTACDLSTELLELQPAATYIIRGSNYQECFHGRLACHQKKQIATNYLHKNHRSRRHAPEHTRNR